MAKSNAKSIPAKSAKKGVNELATREALAAERRRAEALAKAYGGAAEILTLSEARKAHPELEITEDDMKNTSYFHLRFRACSICGRFPARALAHLALHESGELDAKGHRTDPEARKRIAERVERMLETLNEGKKPVAKAPLKRKAKTA